LGAGRVGEGSGDGGVGWRLGLDGGLGDGWACGSSAVGVCGMGRFVVGVGPVGCGLLGGFVELRVLWCACWGFT